MNIVPSPFSNISFNCRGMAFSDMVFGIWPTTRRYDGMKFFSRSLLQSRYTDAGSIVLPLEGLQGRHQVALARRAGRRRYAEDAGLAHLRVLADDRLHVFRLDEVAGAAELGALAEIEEIPSLGVPVHHVAGAEPPAPRLFLGIVRLAQVIHLGLALHHAADELAGLPGRHFLVLVVDDLEFHDARHRLPEGARPAPGRSACRRSRPPPSRTTRVSSR